MIAASGAIGCGRRSDPEIDSLEAVDYFSSITSSYEFYFDFYMNNTRQLPTRACLLVAACLSLLLGGCGGAASRHGISVPDGPRGKAVSAALDEIGTPYRHGASAPGEALDCSALTLHAHRVAGLQIPRMASAQHRRARPVRPARVRPGDLVFFRVGSGHHVGLVVDGERFVHASTSARQVRLAKLGAGYWRNRLIGAGSFFY